MPTINLTSPEYGSGRPFSSPDWVSGVDSIQLLDGGDFAWVRMAGAADALEAGSVITDASMLISNIGQPTTGEQLQVRFDFGNNIYPVFPDCELPVDLSEAIGRHIGDPAPVPAAELQSQTSVNIDITDLLNALLSYGGITFGDYLSFKVINPNYSGSGISGLTAAIQITYEISGPSTPEVTVDDITATATVEEITAAIEPHATVLDVTSTATVETITAAHDQLAVVSDVTATATIETITADASVEVTVSDITSAATVETITAGHDQLSLVPDVTSTATVETITAFHGQLVTVSDISSTATVQSISRAAGWRTATVGNITITAAEAK